MNYTRLFLYYSLPTIRYQQSALNKHTKRPTFQFIELAKPQTMLPVFFHLTSLWNIFLNIVICKFNPYWQTLHGVCIAWRSLCA
jgi:hypothetical protein